MKKIFCLLSLSIVIILFFHPEIYAKEPMKFAYFSDYKPYSWKADNGKMHGIIIDILDECLHNRMGIDITHTGYPWARAQLFVKVGSADAFVTIPTPERKTYTIISSEPVITGKATIFTYVNNPKIKKLSAVQSFSDLKPFKQIQYIGNGWAKKNFKGMNVRWVPTLTDVLDRLVTGNYDYFADSTWVVGYNIRALGYQNRIVELEDVVLSRESFYLCISKKSLFIKIIPGFDKAIRGMRKDGTLEKIYNKYR